MGGKVQYRDVSPIVQIFRNMLRGRGIVTELRYADQLASRTQPHPDVPGGPYHRTTKVYYYTRDARRLVQPPSVISGTQIGDGKKSEQDVKSLTPGPVYLKE